MTRCALACIMMIVTAALAAGCSSAKPSADDFGRSVAAMREAQRPDRVSARGAVPLAGLDGQAAQAVMRRYLGLFEKADAGASSTAQPPPPPGFPEALGITGMPPGGTAMSP